MTRCTICHSTDRRDGWTVRRNGGTVHVECADRRLFVYGTLRSGMGLDTRLRGVRIGDVLLDGAALYEHPCGYYPVVRLGEQGSVVGELVFVDVDDVAGCAALDSILRMEQGAGYTIRTVQVHDRKGRSWDAQVCAWDARRDVAARVCGDDWVRHSRAQVTATERGAMSDSRTSRASGEMSDSRTVSSTTASAQPTEDGPHSGWRTGVLRRRPGPRFGWIVSIDGVDVREAANMTDIGRWAREERVVIERAPAAE